MAETEKDQRTEPATPRRRDEARENGQTGLSQELVAAAMLCAGLGALATGGGAVAHRSGELVVDSVRTLAVAGTSELDVPEAAELLATAARTTLTPLAALLAPVLAVGLLVGYGQIGFRFTPKAVAADPSKVDPFKGLKRLFGARALVRTGMAGVKVAVISAVVLGVAWLRVGAIAQLGPSELGPLLAGLGRVVAESVGAGLAAIVLLAMVDLAFQRWQLSRDLRMTKQEVKEEHRLTEGDPHLRARVRAVQREAATRRMMADVPKATVVVTNPTHYAVALRYDEGGGAPRCVAKGKNDVALRIRDLARESDVPTVEDPPLARALHAQVRIGDEIPEDLYAAVAEVIAYVWRLQGKGVAA